ncbi:hypothetical protein M569_11437, partial [Genlisea aurea]
NALRSIKSSLIDPYGNLANWNRGDPCTSNWTGIICYDTTLDDDNLHVREILLLNQNLSGTLSPELGRLSYLQILDFMWNNISGTIPKEIGNITTLQLLLLNGNQLTGSLPDELGNLSNLHRMQIDQNQISGPLPTSFAKLRNVKHLHLNNNSLSGQIPSVLYQLPVLIHLLLDNNNLSGNLPPEFSEIPSLVILSLRNCNLQGPIPDWSNNTQIAYIDLSQNQLDGNIPSGALSQNITTIDLSNNNLSGTIPDSFSSLPLLQKLSVANNALSGSIPSTIWQSRTLNSNQSLILDFSHNRFSNISGSLPIQQNISLGLKGNPMCSSSNLIQLCGPNQESFSTDFSARSLTYCPPKACPPPYEYAPPSPAVSCFCAAPILIGYRLKSPGFSDFLPYANSFLTYLSSGLNLNAYQLDIASVAWQEGPRLRMYLKIFPDYVNDSVRLLNKSEVTWILEMFSGWKIHNTLIFGPYEFLNFTLTAPYQSGTMYLFPPSSSVLSSGSLAGIVLGSIAGSATLTALVVILILGMRKRHGRLKHSGLLKISGVKDFRFIDLSHATQNFDNSTLVGQGGYGKVYRGVLSDGMVVAIKRAQEGSLQGEHEFLTEIELLSRLHHCNLVSLIGFCDEEDEQMLVYEFMPNGTLRQHLSSEKCKMPLPFDTRVKIALGAARGILYLHTEADPPIFHRDIKSANILLDSNFTAKVADFGLSRLAPLPELEGDIPSHVSTVVKGTPGYLDPEYFRTYKLTDKSDVYSLGVVLLEMMTGMHPIFHGKNIVREVNVAHQLGAIRSIIDDRMGSFPTDCASKFVELALKCCREETHSRPAMAEVVRELENIQQMMTACEWDGNNSGGPFDSSDDSRFFITPPSSSFMTLSSSSSST